MDHYGPQQVDQSQNEICNRLCVEKSKILKMYILGKIKNLKPMKKGLTYLEGV